MGTRAGPVPAERPPREPQSRSPAHQSRGLTGDCRSTALCPGLRLGLHFRLHFQAAQLFHLEGPGCPGHKAADRPGVTHPVPPEHRPHPEATSPWKGADSRAQVRGALTVCHMVLPSASRNSSTRPACWGSGCCFPCSRQCFLYRDSMALGREQRQRPLITGGPLRARQLTGAFHNSPHLGLRTGSEAKADSALPGFQTGSDKSQANRNTPVAGKGARAGLTQSKCLASLQGPPLLGKLWERSSCPCWTPAPLSQGPHR